MFDRDPDQPGKFKKIPVESFAADTPVEELQSEFQDGGGCEVASGFDPRKFFHALGMDSTIRKRPPA